MINVSRLLDRSDLLFVVGEELNDKNSFGCQGYFIYGKCMQIVHKLFNMFSYSLRHLSIVVIYRDDLVVIKFQGVLLNGPLDVLLVEILSLAVDHAGN